MKKNVGTIDRIVRILIAVVIAGLFLGNIITGTLGIILLVLAGILVVTSIVGLCPLYLLFGLNSAKKE